MARRGLIIALLDREIAPESVRTNYGNRHLDLNQRGYAYHYDYYEHGYYGSDERARVAIDPSWLGNGRGWVVVRVVHFIERLRAEDGGAVRAAVDMCVLLADVGHDVVFMTRDADSTYENLAAQSGFTLEVLPPPRRLKWPLGPRALRRAVHRLRGAQVVHLHGVWSLANIQLGRIARRLGIPYVCSVHGALDDWCVGQKKPKKLLFHALFDSWHLRHASRIHCTATGELDQASKWFPRELGFVLPYPIDLAPFQELPGPELARHELGLSSVTEPIVLFLSRIHHKKGLDVLVEAAGQLRARGIAFHLVVAGPEELPGYVKRVKSRVDALDLTDSVRFVGMVTGRAKYSLYQASTVYVLPTSQENFGIALLEAAACECPVVTTRGTDIWQDMERAGAAAVVERTPTAFANVIGELLADGSRREEMGARGRRWALTELDGTKLRAGLVAQYDAVRSTNC